MNNLTRMHGSWGIPGFCGTLIHVSNHSQVQRAKPGRKKEGLNMDVPGITKVSRKTSLLN